jgi:hypothetical protein
VPPVKMESFLSFTETINSEIRLLKGRRKSANEIVRRLKKSR